MSQVDLAGLNALPRVGFRPSTILVSYYLTKQVLTQVDLSKFDKEAWLASTIEQVVTLHFLVLSSMLTGLAEEHTVLEGVFRPTRTKCMSRVRGSPRTKNPS